MSPVVSTEPIKPICKYCGTLYRVDLFKGEYVCHGFCRRVKTVKKEPANKSEDISDIRSDKNNEDTKPKPEPNDMAQEAGKQFEVGDFVVATFTQDNLEYEGELVTSETDPDTEFQYGVVRFLGYNNEETKWLDDLKPSNGEEARKRQIHEATSDEAKLEGDAEPEAEVKLEVNPQGQKWKVGDFVVATFSEDNVEYEGELMTVETDPDSNHLFGSVKFLGYNNEETQWLDDLKPSKGEEARKRQIQYVTKFTADEKPAAEVKPEVKDETKEASGYEWKAGDFISFEAEQGEVSEGVINSIKEDEANSGQFYAVITKLGSEGTYFCWLNQIQASRGQEAREAQKTKAVRKIKKAAADDETTDKDEVKGLEVKKPAADGHEKNPVTTKKEEDKTDNGQGRADKEDSTKKESGVTMTKRIPLRQPFDSTCADVKPEDIPLLVEAATEHQRASIAYKTQLDSLKKEYADKLAALAKDNKKLLEKLEAAKVDMAAKASLLADNRKKDQEIKDLKHQLAQLGGDNNNNNNKLNGTLPVASAANNLMSFNNSFIAGGKNQAPIYFVPCFAMPAQNGIMSANSSDDPSNGLQSD